MASTYCPECDGTITADNPRMGEMIKCGECATEFEIISTNPFDIDYPIEDYYEDEDEDEDENY